MSESKRRPLDAVVYVGTKYKSFEEAKAKAPEQIAAHIARSRELHQNGTLLMSGAFLNNPDEPLSTMEVLRSHVPAEEYKHGHPFFINRMISKWYILEWANMFP